MLDRIGDEVARATTIVRFAPGSSFAEHVHGGGEEYFVLEGDFVDEDGSHRTGAYVRNPPLSRHSPSAPHGAMIFVKLNQFAADDRSTVVIDTSQFGCSLGDDTPAVESLVLHCHGEERVRIEVWRPDVEIAHSGHGGLEILVLDGDFMDAGESYQRYSWLRIPPSEPLAARAGKSGVRMLVKSGHLSELAVNGIVWCEG